MLTVVRKEIKIMLAEKVIFFWLIVLPIIFIVLFATLLGNENPSLTVRYIDLDRSSMSQAFLEQMRKIKGIQLETDTNQSLHEQVEKIKKGQLSSLLVIPKGFEKKLAAGEQADLQLYHDAGSNQAVSAIQAVLENMVHQYREQKLRQTFKQLGQTDLQTAKILKPPIRVQKVSEHAVKLDPVSQVVPGYTVMFVFYIMITIVQRFLKERDSGMVARLQGTALTPFQYLMGMWIPNILVVCVQCTVLLGFGHWVYGMNVGNLWAIAAVILGLSICGTGLGLALAMLVKGENQGIAMIQLFALGGALLGGLWFPMEFLPAIAQVIGKLLPQYWAQVSLQDIVLRGANIGDIWLSLVVLFAFGFVGLIIAWLRFPRYLRSAVH